MSTDTEAKPTKRPRKMAREPYSEVADQALLARQARTDLVLDLHAQRRCDARTTGRHDWLAAAHCAGRADRLKKKGHSVSSTKVEGGPRDYCVVGA